MRSRLLAALGASVLALTGCMTHSKPAPAATAGDIVYPDSELTPLYVPETPPVIASEDPQAARIRALYRSLDEGPGVLPAAVLPDHPVTPGVKQP